LADVAVYMLVDPAHTPTRDTRSRPWRPVIVTGDQVTVGPGPSVLDRLLAAVGYFDRPDAFGNMLLTHFHRLAFDFFQGFQVRGEKFESRGDRLYITGEATQGAGNAVHDFTFETRVGRHEPATFTAEAVPSLFD
jgi:hypothetical protein